ncbi:MAG: FAD:protein FMN transferase [Verrucomicrobiales bacterium]
MACLTLACAALTGCRHDPEPKPSVFTVQAISPVPAAAGALQAVQRSQTILGRQVMIICYGEQIVPVQLAIDAAFEAFFHALALTSNDLPESELTSLNERAAREQVQVSAEMYYLLAKGQSIAALTEGSFDLTVGPLAQLWGFNSRKYYLPTKDELNQSLALVAPSHLQILPDRRVYFARPGVTLDLGNMSNGFAVDAAVETLIRRRVPAAMVKSGGDLRVIGAPPGQTAWLAPLAEPGSDGRGKAILLRDGALSTTANEEHSFLIDNKVYSHVLDPRTGWPVEGVRACTVMAASCMESDAWANALFVYGPDKTIHKFGKDMPVRFLLAPAGRKGEQKVKSSENFPQAF